MGNDLVTSQSIVAMLAEEVTETVTDPAEASLAIGRRILTAPDAESVLTPASTISTDELVGEAVELRDYRVMRSDIEGGIPYYMLLEAVRLDTGELIMIDTSSLNIMAQVWKLKRLEALPRRVRIIAAGRRTRQGYVPLWLTAAES